jgi:glucosamine kinase
VALYIGIDAGGSKTTCVVGDEETVLASATSGGSNVVRCGEAAARAQLHDAIRKACSAGKVEISAVRRICIGIAGAARPAIDAVVRSAIAEFYSGEVVVVGDMVIAMEAAFGGEPGIIVIAGTGSIAYGRNFSGKTARAGGWGFAISDEGSGHWIGRAAISAVMRARDESDAPPGTLAQAILRAWKLNTLDDLIRAANSPGADFSLLCPSVIAVADGNDRLARGVLTQAGTELGHFGAIVARRLGMDQDPVPVAMSGGVFRSSELVRNVFSRSLQSDCPNAVLRSEVIDPVGGALRIARAGTLKQ